MSLDFTFWWLANQIRALAIDHGIFIFLFEKKKPFLDQEMPLEHQAH